MYVVDVVVRSGKMKGTRRYEKRDCTTVSEIVSGGTQKLYSFEFFDWLEHTSANKREAVSVSVSAR